MPFYEVLYFSVDRSCVSLVGFILKHFVFFYAVAGSIVLIYVFIYLTLYVILCVGVHGQV